jgi:hypothetical protein
VFLIDRSTAKVDEAARAVLTMQGVIAVYTLGPANAAYRLHTALNATMTLTEMAWWKARAQSIIDGMASLGAPDVVGLLHDETSYGVFGDHGGHQEAAQRVPVVFWSKNIAASVRSDEFRSVDILPTILAALKINQTAPNDGRAASLLPASPAPTPGMPIKDEPSYIGIVLLIVGGVYCVLAVCAVATIKLKNRFKKLYYKRQIDHA